MSAPNMYRMDTVETIPASRRSKDTSVTTSYLLHSGHRAVLLLPDTGTYNTCTQSTSVQYQHAQIMSGPTVSHLVQPESPFSQAMSPTSSLQQKQQQQTTTIADGQNSYSREQQTQVAAALTRTAGS